MRLSEAYRALLAFQELANDLEREAAVNATTARLGSPVTSWWEDHAMGELAKEQMRLVKRMCQILVALPEGKVNTNDI